MSSVPNSLPDDDLRCHSVTELVRTFCGICQESTLTRADILGSMEVAKDALLHAWRKDDEEEDL